MALLETLTDNDHRGRVDSLVILKRVIPQLEGKAKAAPIAERFFLGQSAVDPTSSSAACVGHVEDADGPLVPHGHILLAFCEANRGIKGVRVHNLDFDWKKTRAEPPIQNWWLWRRV